MMRLYGNYGTASLAPHMLLEELGLAYEFRRVDTEQGEQRSAEYLKLNPNGRVPTLVDGEAVLYEAAAICLHLADKCPESGLLPAVGTTARGQAYKWLIFLTNTLQPALIAYFYPERFSTDPAHASAIKTQAELTALNLYRQVDADLAQAGPYLLGEAPCVADFYLLMLVRWGRWFATPPVTVLPAVARLVTLMSERPAVRRSFEQEGIPAPYCLLPGA
ncbi:MAG: glutathione S-transferase family protein [Gammaproteobacteria bacterium]|nr:glutathione S-transferase family protein [Gammaproteobacteria bacterium]